MSQNAISVIAALAALTFLAMVLNACASSEHRTAGPAQIAAADVPLGHPEFHGARIGPDALRSRLPGE
jgi:hypothetical protein